MFEHAENGGFPPIPNIAISLGEMRDDEESGYHILREALWLCPAIGDCPTCMNSQHPLLDVLLPSGKASRDIQGEK